MRWSLLTVLVIVVGGCVLQTEPCGIDFVERDGRCVPIDAPSPYYGDAQADQEPEFGQVDAGTP